MSIKKPNKFIESIYNIFHIYSPKTYKECVVICDYIRKGYYENGELLYETPYVNSEKHGIEKWYYETGELESEWPYINGEKHGISKRIL